MLFIEKLAEQQIAAARDRGELDNLPGQGRPLTLDDDSAVPADLRAGYRVLKNGGFIPPEIARLKEIRHIECLLPQIESQAQRKQLLLKLGLLRSTLANMPLSTAHTAKQYQDKIIKRLIE